MASADVEQVDALADGLLSVIKPAVEEVDARVEAVRWVTSVVVVKMQLILHVLQRESGGTERVH